MNLSKISLSTKNKDLYQIFVDNRFLCSISGNDLLDIKLAPGDEISQEQLNNLLFKSLKGKLANSALRYLGSRPHSENEIRQYLKKKLYTEQKETPEYANINTKEAIDLIVQNLQSQNYINDEDFAKWLVTQRTSMRNTKSKNAIRAELQTKGIDTALITETLSTLSAETEITRAAETAKKKLKQLQTRGLEPKELYVKLSRYLISKGYSWDTTQSAVDSLLKPF